MVKTKELKKSVSPTLLGWLFIPCWVFFVYVITRTDFSMRVLQNLTAEGSTLAVVLSLLIPIALVTIPITYRPNFGRYLFRNEAKRAPSRAARGVLSLLATIFILLATWYIFIRISVAFS